MTAGCCPDGAVHLLPRGHRPGRQHGHLEADHAPHRHGEEAGPHLDGPRLLLAVRQRDQDPGPDHPVPRRDDGCGFLHDPGARRRRRGRADVHGPGKAPDEVLWDGIDDNGKRVADGKYTATLLVSYSNGSKPTAETTPFFVDNHVPQIDVSADALLFSPTPDSKLPAVTIKQSSSTEDLWEGEMRSSAGQKVRGWFWKGNAADFAWDGKDDNGNLMPDGYYTLRREVHVQGGHHHDEGAARNPDRHAADPRVRDSGRQRLLAERRRVQGHDQLQHAPDAEGRGEVVEAFHGGGGRRGAAGCSTGLARSRVVHVGRQGQGRESRRRRTACTRRT